MIIGFLAVLSASVAAGMRIALPLLVILVLYSEPLLENLPWLRWLPPQVLISIFAIWALFELFGSKKLLGQRILQVVQLFFSPLAGLILSMTAAQVLEVEFEPFWLIGVIGALIAFVFNLILTGWFFRLRGLPIWWSFTEDILCVVLVLFAFRSPQQGGVLAMMLLWLAVRSSTEWKRYYDEGRSPQRSELADDIDDMNEQGNGEGV
ncbi:hypothetical protein Lepto7376_1290 [[Leptolyngbya] sp. PCC 7376]|uniref:DUF4126 domain-containing protein n=1 Tax=[Leptolyngbya] sp. PCC 7376 TaxID=111781 RepID=UPI00029F2592|nr:DUF4126 domain-containing protein [[Leptolyngbya] sp. PCC 7376]AFY37643.1 hypothetical protein Lepto7376_1290 [[Leptolyngbya] sp. PCC 7376]